MALPFFHDISFPAYPASHTLGGPAFPLTVFYTEHGGEFRRTAPSAGAARYDIDDISFSPSQRDALLAFYRAREGGRYGFRFRDRNDDRAENALLGIGNGIDTSFPISKSYSSDAYTVTRPILTPEAGSVTVYVDGVAQTSGVTVESNGGIITFDTAPADGVAITASYRFDVPVRFATEQLIFAHAKQGRVTLTKPLQLQEILR